MLLGVGLLAQEPLTVAEAIRRAWTDQAGLRAGQALVEAREVDAEALRDLRLPSLTLSANGVRTNEPMQAFGIKLNQARIASSDFNPTSLNHPDPISAFGGSFVVQQPLYAGGRISSARRAGAFMAQAEQASQERRKQETAQQVVEAYFGAQAAEQALLWAEETLAWVRGMEAFVDARVAQGLMLEAEAQRLKAAHAQVEAQRVEAQARVRNARSGLGLLTGKGPFQGGFATPLDLVLPEAVMGSNRADLVAASFQAQAAQEQAKAASGSLLPEVGLELGVGTLHQSWSDKGNWSWAAVGVKWRVFSAPDRSKAHAARAQARAAEETRTFKQQQAEHETRVARENMSAAEARVVAARQALAAAEESKRLREARHREGLTPLTEVLDAEAVRQGARALLLQSLYDLRTSRAALDLATGAPIEGVTP
ncbi:TolC family protein [Geothrix sp. PMB-07]|uniref:TolC family protein n=1 Tax=Geothrix sp. PMB-07 TaxID=3068640 RepID=UPI002741988B|nr:TolC family protein [Geothrix sp. PMB-07]WLT32529.1 TolC family protein [Geothrix sp. PMB-07]